MLTRRAALSAITTPLLAQKTRRPNIVFILIDDLRHDALHCTGHPFVRTPHIDRIASEGVVFKNAFVTTPLCSPSRGSYLTGQYVHKHGVVGNRPGIGFEEISHKLETWPKMLHAAGYETGYFGKWHMGNDDSPRPGFDRWVSFKGQGVYNDPPMNIDGKQVMEPGYMTDILGRHAAAFLRTRRDKPFCAYVAHKAIHGPFTPAEKYKAGYAADPIARQPNYHAEPKGKPTLAKVRQGMGSNDELIRNQLRCINSIDDSVGAIYQALEESGQLANTMIVFTSDNGYFWGEHGLGDKRWAYEESIRIPMIARLPGVIRPKSTNLSMVANIDIAPTMLHLAGVEVPKPVHGRSWVPLFRGYRSAWRSSLLTEYIKEEQFPRTPTWRAIRTPEWKYIHYPETQAADELYNLKADPFELVNRIDDGAAEATRAKLRQAMARELEATS